MAYVAPTWRFSLLVNTEVCETGQSLHLELHQPCAPVHRLLPPALCHPPSSPLAGMLGFEFYKCARSAQQKNLERRSRSFSHVFMPDGRQLKFYRGARKNIPERVLEKIR